MHLLFLIAILITPNLVHSIEESFCAGTGYRDGFSSLREPKSTGWSTFDRDPHSRVWATNHATSPAPSSEQVILNIRKVEETARDASSDLNGWLQLSIKPASSTGSRNSYKIVLMSVWALTDTRESIGEFLSPDFAKCDSIAALHTDENIVPCAAAPANEPSAPNMFVYVARNASEFLKEVNLLWRTSVSYCNFPKKFRFMIATNSLAFSKNPSKLFKLTEKAFGPNVYASRWLSPKFYGAASAPLFDENELKCKTSIQVSKPQWIKSITGSATNGELVKVEKEWLNERWKGNKPTEVSENVNKRRTCKPEKGSYAFAGRCTASVGNGVPKVTSTSLHKCDTNNNFEPSDLSDILKERYDDYITMRENELKANCDCPPIPSPDEVLKASGSGRRKREDIFYDEVTNIDNETVADAESVVVENVARAPPDSIGNAHIDPPARPYILNLLAKCNPNGVSNGSFTKDEQGLCVNSQPGKLSYGVRQWHAISLLFCVIVLNPISSYMARFLKGTFTHQGKSPVPMKSWYIVHIAIILPMICMYTTGMAAIFRQRPVLGYSYSRFAQFHRIFGYLMFLLGFFEIVSGILRPTNLLLRRVVIALHWFGGTLMNYAGLILCILSYRIPASPTAFVSHVNRKQFESIFSHMAPLILVVWGIVDILFKLFMTVPNSLFT
ncbi:unnamed protein product [Orchesella dallaii]|uniref:Ferric-chelate reductase 1 n=1 Tax=Orchesella dallaii TaxID=48710 RepID=A0ABP1RAQ4_9HEXA